MAKKLWHKRDEETSKLGHPTRVVLNPAMTTAAKADQVAVPISFNRIGEVEEGDYMVNIHIAALLLCGFAAPLASVIIALAYSILNLLPSDASRAYLGGASAPHRMRVLSYAESVATVGAKLALGFMGSVLGATLLTDLWWLRLECGVHTRHGTELRATVTRVVNGIAVRARLATVVRLLAIARTEGYRGLVTRPLVERLPAFGTGRVWNTFSHAIIMPQGGGVVYG